MGRGFSGYNLSPLYLIALLFFNVFPSKLPEMEEIETDFFFLLTKISILQHLKDLAFNQKANEQS